MIQNLKINDKKHKIIKNIVAEFINNFIIPAKILNPSSVRASVIFEK
ncbi:hypothetical protein FACS1894142_1620 [Spirochaetia bacterium]|nr:hypothetical protein FACS1894142_1620 [Spirochaetia bacterium]